MELSVRPCSSSDEKQISALQWPETTDYRQLFGFTHTGALIETSFLTLGAFLGNKAVGFFAVNESPSSDHSRYPEVSDYLRKKLSVGKPNGCVVLVSYSQDPSLSHASVITRLFFHLFVTRSDIGGVVLLASPGVDPQNFNAFSRIFSSKEALCLSSGGLCQIFTTLRSDYLPSISIRMVQQKDNNPLSQYLHTQFTVEEQNQLIERLTTNRRTGKSDAQSNTNEDSDHSQKSLNSSSSQELIQIEPQQKPRTSWWWTNDEKSLSKLLSTTDDVDYCLIAEPLKPQAKAMATSNPCGFFTFSKHFPDDYLDIYAKLFGKLEMAVPPHTLPSSQPLRLILYGPTGAGKDTQAKFLVDSFHLIHISMGSILRQNIAEKTPLGQQAERYVSEGRLVPEELIGEIILDKLRQADCQSKGWILNGFPKTEKQARLLISNGVWPSQVILLHLSDEQVLKRLSPRRVDMETDEVYHLVNRPPPENRLPYIIQRQEDTTEQINVRLSDYHAHQNLVIEAFAKLCPVVHIDAAFPTEHIRHEVEKEIYQHKNWPLPVRKRRHVPKIVMTGKPGAGKTTQCAWISKCFGIVHLTLNDPFADEPDDPSPAGQFRRQLRTDVVMEMLRNRMDESDCQTHGWVLDGFLQTPEHATLMIKSGIIPTVVVALDIPDEIIQDRLSGRIFSMNGDKPYHVDLNRPPILCVTRQDSYNAKKVADRLQQYHTNKAGHIAETLGAFSPGCTLVRVNGEQSVADVAELITERVERSIVQSNAFMMSLFSMEQQHLCRVEEFVNAAFEHVADKDWMVLGLSEHVPQPSITKTFRRVKLNVSLSTCSRMWTNHKRSRAYREEHDEGAFPFSVGDHKLNGAKPRRRMMVLYAIHRHEVKYLRTASMGHENGEEEKLDEYLQRQANATGAARAVSRAVVGDVEVKNTGILTSIKRMIKKMDGNLHVTKAKLTHISKVSPTHHDSLQENHDTIQTSEASDDEG